MSDFYTNVALNRNNILVRGYLGGVRYQQSIPYKPYAFLPSKKADTEYHSLQGQPLERFDFDSVKDARDFYDRYKDVKNFAVFGFDKFVYQFISDAFPGQIDYDVNLIQTHNLDIETDATGGFADLATANKPVTLIGLGYKSEGKKRRVILGYKEPYIPKHSHVDYIDCADEHDMLRKFINIWADKDTSPDVVTGWNIEKYDIPYLVTRIKRELGEAEAKRLSPWGILREKEIEHFGKPMTVYTPVGISVLDYMDLYKKFTQGRQQESFSLDHIAFVETGKRKLDYSEYDGLQELYNQNYEKYVDYNIVDIDRVDDIDDKNKFLELAFAMAYDAKVNFVDSMTSVLLWDVIIYNHLINKKVVVPKSMRTEYTDIPGGYVKEPDVGMYKWVVSFDLQSLYPHLILQYNISPETLHSFSEWRLSDIDKVIAGDYDSTEIKAKNLTQAANGARFKRDKQGFLPELMRIQFDKRAEYKRRMIELKKTGGSASEISKYDNWQMAKKIQLNSAYGALANEYFRFYDWRLASAVTLSGQLAVRWIEAKLNKYLNALCQTKDFDYVIAMDTDSCYINLEPIVQGSMGKAATADIVNAVDQVCKNNIQDKLDQWFGELKDTLNGFEQAMFMKREAIADKVFWRGKKNYAMNVHNSEGVSYDPPDVKIMGLECVKSVIPQACRTAMKETIRLILNGTEQEVKDYVAEFRKEFDQLPFEDIAFPKSVNNIDKWRDPVTIWKKCTPIHVKAALVYNGLLKERGLDTQYPVIHNKDKMKFAYLTMPNPAKSKVIGAPRQLPRDLDINKYIDREKMWENTFLSPIKSILDVIGWKHEDQSTLEAFFT